ncbi:MAG: hypothetical protein IJA62_05405 [Ruminococcus sp.]|nr:hypothetical protein [Ruminococcus sp.]
MIKGINKQVIEINNTGNPYYEKAWLIVKPEYTCLHMNILEREAQKLLKDTDRPSCMKTKRNLAFWALRLGASALLGAAVCALVQSAFL